MNVLLDTHILIWALYSPERLPQDIRTVLEDERANIEYSIVSLWEIEIKHNKFSAVFDFSAEATHVDAQLSGFHMMKMTPYQIGTLGKLNEPKRMHKDPFDRMLIAQAKFENVYLLTHDKRLAEYDEECVQYF